MGKKQKSNRNKATAVLATVAAAESVRRTEGNKSMKAYEKDSLFPISSFFIKAKAFNKKGNQYKANKIYLQGIHNGCVHCLTKYSYRFITAVGDSDDDGDGDDSFHNENVHLGMPLFLEGSIRGSTNCIAFMMANSNLPAINMYWCKYAHQQGLTTDDDDDDAEKTYKTERKGFKTNVNNICRVCKIDADTVSLKRCERCSHYHYCGGMSSNRNIEKVPSSVWETHS